MRKEKKKVKVTIASIVYELIEKGKSDDAIIKIIKNKFPESKINESHLVWYRRQLKLTKEETKKPKDKTEDKKKIVKKTTGKKKEEDSDEEKEDLKELGLDDDEDDGYEE